MTMDSNNAKGRTTVTEAFRLQLKAERAAAGLTQGELAKSAGMSRATINRMETDARTLDVAQLDAICRALRLPLSEFITRAEKRMRQNQSPPDAVTYREAR